jgi:hypothetical protein
MISFTKSLFRLTVVTFVFAMLMPVTTTQAGPDCLDPKHANNPNCGGGDPTDPISITYEAGVEGGSFPFAAVPVTLNGHEGALLPLPAVELIFTRPGLVKSQACGHALH